MSEGFVVKFFSRGAWRSPCARVEDFGGGVEVARYFLDSFGQLGDAEFTLSVSGEGRGPDSLTLNVERTRGAGVLLQVYVPEAASPAGEAGWYDLVEPAHRDEPADGDISTTYESGNPPDMFESRLSQGILFSRRLYVPADAAIDSLNLLLETGDLRTVLTERPWKFLGLI